MSEASPTRHIFLYAIRMELDQKLFAYLHPSSLERGRDILDLDDFTLVVSETVPQGKIFVSPTPVASEFKECVSLELPGE